MIVLGIDPGIGVTGYGVAEEQGSGAMLLEHGAIRTPPHAPLPERLKAVFHGLDAICRRFDLDCMAIEQLFFNTNATTALSVGQARGVALLVAAQHGLEVAEYTPLQIKQAVTGYGRADKTQVQRMVQSLLGLADIIRPDDAADAVAVCLCHLQSYRYRRAVSKGGSHV